MITAILNLIIRLLNFIIGFILSIVLSAFPDLDLGQFTSAFASFFAILGKGLNILYFMSGGWLFIFGDIVILLFVAKHIALPIVNFTRKVLIK